MTAARRDVGKNVPAAGAIIRAAITDDEWTVQRAASLAANDPGGYMSLAFLIARSAAALLVDACGSEAQATALVNDWIYQRVKIRTRAAA
jgi:hypothetical protein